ncbi:SEFIR domain-containing protein [Mammaliicoccus sciuri]
MSTNELVAPKTFISYSWTTPEHEEWVLELATRLISDGVQVILDKWDLREGHDIHRFMETMVHDDDAIDKVLIICDRGYKEKADKRQGGVGIESQIITPNIYTDVQQEKFIPIIAERDISGAHFIPNYIASRLYIDLSSTEAFEDNYERLLRSIYNKPMYRKPTLGKTPSFLLEEHAPRYLTTPILNKMRVASEKYPHKMQFLWGEFKESLFDTLDTFQLNIDNPEGLDNLIVEKIQLMIPLRNDFVDAIELLSMTNSIDSDTIIEFFEEIFKFSEFRGNGSFYESQHDHFKFFIMETFLYVMTILFKTKKYHIISEIINSDFHLESRTSNHRSASFVHFRFHLESLERVGAKANPKRLSIHADLINNFKHKKYGNELLETDLILYYVSKINSKFDDYYSWFPISYFYLSIDKPIRLLTKLKSKSHFNEVKSIFSVDDEADLADKITNFKLDRGYSGSWNGIPHPSTKIDTNTLCTLA